MKSAKPVVNNQQTIENREPERSTDTDFDSNKIEQPVSAGVPSGTDKPDPFDPGNLRLSQNFGASLGVKKVLTTIPVRKPNNTWFIRVHPDPRYRLETAVIELKEDQETYLVAPDLRHHLATESTFKPRALYTAINRQGTLFIWVVGLPGPDGRDNEWNRSARLAVELGTKGWIRVQANTNLGAYEVFEAKGELSEPDFPDVPFRDLLEVAFEDKYIDSLDHVVLRKLRGEL